MKANAAIPGSIESSFRVGSDLMDKHPIHDEIITRKIKNKDIPPSTEEDLKKNQKIIIPPSEENHIDLSIISVSSSKIPFRPWKQYQSEPAPIDQWWTHFNIGGYVGIITGKVSGNLECIDIDLKNDPEKKIFDQYIEIIPYKLLRRLILQTTPNGGYHLIYRCPSAEINSNLKLANTKDGETLIETRGQGGYFCHHLKDYQVIQGRFNLMELDLDIPEISEEEREILLDLARSLDRKVHATGSTYTGYSEPAIVNFNSEFEIIPLFEKYGWSVYKEDDENITLARPGSSAPYSGYYFKGTRTFICFSTSTEFKVQKPYNHFQVLRTLEGDDDYHKTLKMLPGYGFELQKSSSKKVNVDEIAEYLNNQGVQNDVFRQDLIFKGEILTETVNNTLHLDLCKEMDKEIPRTKFESVIKSLYIEQFNPILAFIDQYSDRQPQGTFNKWLDCLELKNKSIDRNIVLHFFRKWYVGMIAQALDGPYPNEFFLALLSQNQGIGKTTTLRQYILPVELRDYQAEHALSFSDDFKVLMGQVLLLIDDELDGRSFEMSQSFKNILSTGVNTTRRPYDRRISSIKRRASFAGSGNALNIIRERGERRIIPIEVEKFDRDKLNDLDLIDLFIEAYHLFSEGFVYSFQSEDKALLDTLYQDHYQESDIDLIIEDLMELPQEQGDSFYITLLDCVKVFADHYPATGKRNNVINLGKKMKEHGFESQRVGPKKTTCYIIGGGSRIIELLNEDSQSWRLLTDRIN